MSPHSIRTDLRSYHLTPYLPLVERINALEAAYENLSSAQLRFQTNQFRQRVQQGESLDSLLVEAFATVREAAKRILGLRMVDVQLIGGMVLHQGKIAEMPAGEGKTLVATLPLYLRALSRQNVHLATINDYLVRRDARWMAPVFNALGLTVGVVQAAARTENGKKAFLVDLSREAADEELHQLRQSERQEAYQADITYGSFSEFCFDYLRDHLISRAEERVQRGLNYVLVDEVDIALIDEARTPIQITGPVGGDDPYWYQRMNQVVARLTPDDYEIDDESRSVALTEAGERHVEDLLEMSLHELDQSEDITPEQARLLGYLEQAMRARYIFRRGLDYEVIEKEVVVRDRDTQQLQPNRRWSDGLHQALEAKEGLKVSADTITYATITIQNYFGMYASLAGMTGTAQTEAEEFRKMYRLGVVRIPTNLEYEAGMPQGRLAQVAEKDEFGYAFHYYARRDDPRCRPLYFKRKDYPDVVYRTMEAKLRAVVDETLRCHVLGRPVLIGTDSTELSEKIAERFWPNALFRHAQVILTRKKWMQANHIDQAETSHPELVFLEPDLDKLPIAQLYNFARNNGLGSIVPGEEANLYLLLEHLSLPEEYLGRLAEVLQKGIPHSVLQGRRHVEESVVIARAGAYGAVTITTKLAGRGVDIKLGGALDDEALAAVNQHIRTTTGMDPYSMPLDDRWEALNSYVQNHGLPPDPQKARLLQQFLDYMQQRAQVYALGGLAVIGAGRYEARRVDDQLRGRAARQGDPGSSRFYLSLEDQLMVYFGGQQVNTLMDRMKIDNNLPIESNLVVHLVAQSQLRLEGANFDVRKRMVDFDNVLNRQCQRIYEQRDLIFNKEDLSDDLAEIVRRVLKEMVPQTLGAEPGWKFATYLDQIQPFMSYEELHYPTFSIRLLAERIQQRMAGRPQTRAAARELALALANEALESERAHVLQNFEEQLERSGAQLETQLEEQYKRIATFVAEQAQDNAAHTDMAHINAAEYRDALQERLRLLILPITDDEILALRSRPGALAQRLEHISAAHLQKTAIQRLWSSAERMTRERIPLPKAELDALDPQDWQGAADVLLAAFERGLLNIQQRILSEDGRSAIHRDIDFYLSHLPEGPLSFSAWIDLLAVMQETQLLMFDRSTHRSQMRTVRRVQYSFLVGGILDNQPLSQTLQQVLDHFLGALDTLRQMWGRHEWNRLKQNEITLDHLYPHLIERIRFLLGAPDFYTILTQPLQTIAEDDSALVQEVLGWYILNDVTRHLLIGAISELWVEYLTRVETLRVAIGLEAYASRDPLIVYRNRGVEMFHQLIQDIRTAVMGRIFTYRPSLAGAQAADSAEQTAQAAVEDPQEPPPPGQQDSAAQAEN